MRVHVATGFLGAGKTTLLLSLVGRLSAREKVLVLVNEVGRLGIDGAVLSRGGLETIELPGGCICCSLATGLLDTLQKARDIIRPDRILIEPTGVAVPSQIDRLLTQPPLDEWCTLGPFICMVDAIRYRQMAGSPLVFWHDQVETSDVLLLNKIDRVSAGERDWMMEDLAGRNPGAVIHPTMYAELPGETWETILSGVHRSPEEREGVTFAQKRIEVWDLERQAPLARQGVERWLSEMEAGRFGDVLRAKGDVCDEDGCRHLDWIPGGVDWSEPLGVATRLVVIGQALDRAALDAAFA